MWHECMYHIYAFSAMVNIVNIFLCRYENWILINWRGTDSLLLFHIFFNNFIRIHLIKMIQIHPYICYHLYNWTRGTNKNMWTNFLNITVDTVPISILLMEIDVLSISSCLWSNLQCFPKICRRFIEWIHNVL